MDKSINKLNEVTRLRVFAIITLVAWHSYCPYICWGLATSSLDFFYTQIFRWIAPTAQMPLFIFLAGYLYYYLHVDKGKYQEFVEFVKNKFHRLVVPYLVLGFIINMTELTRMNPIDLFYGTPCHLWYCLMLFYCFIVCWLVEKYLGRIVNIVLAIASFCFVLYNGGQYFGHSPFGILIPTYYYCYFFLGYLFYNYRDRIITFTQKYVLIVVGVWVLSLIYSFDGHSQGMAAVLFILLLLSITDKQKRMPPKRWVEIIAKYSFGIFVFHQWIIWNVTRYGRITSIMNEHYILFPLLLFVSVFCISTLLTHLSLKTKIGRYLLT